MTGDAWSGVPLSRPGETPRLRWHAGGFAAVSRPAGGSTSFARSDLRPRRAKQAIDNGTEGGLPILALAGNTKPGCWIWQGARADRGGEGHRRAGHVS